MKNVSLHKNNTRLFQGKQQGQSHIFDEINLLFYKENLINVILRKNNKGVMKGILR